MSNGSQGVARPSSFNQLGLSAKLLEVLKTLKLTRPTSIQSLAWEPAKDGQDIVALAETGSGKTLAYLLPVFHRLMNDSKARALILTPTRETAEQIYNVIDPFATELEMTLSLVIGGRPAAQQVSELKKKARLIVATPGRMNDHLLNNKLLLQEVKTVVIDEADRMLDMGFAPQLKAIQKTMRGTWQTMMFSASDMDQVTEVAKLFIQNEPVVLRTDSAEAPVRELRQKVVHLERRDKNQRLIDEIGRSKGSTIVFTASQERCDFIYEMLKDHEFKVDLLHGALTQGHRTRVVRDFRAKTFQILVATDVVARGLDVPHVDLVVNMDLPYAAEDFLHRIGRTARAGRKGQAVTFITKDDREMFEAIQPYLEGAEVEG